ncbi:hypothetical protein GFY24_02685 [Nocardia sp. SYP-A9097]|uniref:SCO2521 family protein n=1 Tax=Nocardia sp. SYP-A9097 TaxID=2663237 RepID=UPI00129A6BB7|nr:SCO2521 family protein [Nocardia sp. SYP-A9097]MRH86384.1 hypothetical protein [Nocardia sp. SYP-A9097]
MTEPLVLLGEVRTGLLPTLSALSTEQMTELLKLVPGQPVRMWQRPSARAISSDTAVGVDCQLATPSHKNARAIGTAASHGVILGGRIVQSSSSVQVVRASKPRRMVWQHYLSQVGTMELINRVGEDGTAATELIDGFLHNSRDDTLDLGSISDLLFTRLRTDAGLGNRSPFRTKPTRLRWAARVESADARAVSREGSLAFRLQDESTRMVLITIPHAANLLAVQRFCEDLAAHDWLLTTLEDVLAGVEQEEHPRDVITRLAPPLEHLAHLWMPGAHTPPSLREFWRWLDDEPGFSRQWAVKLGQLRDRLSGAALTLACAESPTGVGQLTPGPHDRLVRERSGIAGVMRNIFWRNR